MQGTENQTLCGVVFRLPTLCFGPAVPLLAGLGLVGARRTAASEGVWRVRRVSRACLSSRHFR